MTDLWERSRSGSHAGRGFRFQDAVATELALRAWRGELPVRRLIPEGLEDVSLELDSHWLHLQAKSRRAHRGDFSAGELRHAWRHLAERLAADPAAHGGLVLERPLGGVDSGLEEALADIAGAELKKSIKTAVAGLIDGDEFLGRTHLLVMPASPPAVVGLLAERLQIPPARCVAHYAILRAELGHLADENGEQPANDPAAMTVGDVSKLIENVSEAVDPSLLDEAVRTGVAELVDFSTAIDDERFFSGVDVVIGHVVAGLPLERPELTDALAVGLDERRLALAVGPSGAGKSALIWLTAFATRHLVQWYRVRRLQVEDVAPLVRLIKGWKGTGASVGFVIDDVGRDDRAGFDHLVEELRQQPHALVLGACREEDVVVVRSAPQAAQVRPRLDEELAERIWRELETADATPWLEWREPYEKSEGLLLEYGHLLTEGERLEQTVAAQIERRVREQRALELAVLALVATADAFGAELDSGAVGQALGANATEMKGALGRLVAEHLISDRDGSLSGLHELRSRYAMNEIHWLPPPTLADSVRRVIELLAPATLQAFLTRLLLETAVADEVAIDAVVSRFRKEPDAVALAAALQALRLVGFRRMTVQWHQIFLEEEAAPTNVAVVAHFALHGGDHDFFPEPIQRAVARIRELEPADLRLSLLTRIGPELQLAFAGADLDAAAAALAALSEVGPLVGVEASALAAIADGASIEELRRLFEAAYAAAPELARNLADELGGVDGLLARLERERPWVRNARLGVDDRGRATAEAEYAFVAESAQPDPHGAVVELARYLLALAPAAEVAVCRAVDATGETAGFGGVPLADKAIERRYLPTEAQVAWNRARGRAAVAAVASVTETDYVRAARDIVVDTAQLVRRAGDSWVRGKAPSRRLVADAVVLAEAANRLAPPPVTIDSVGPFEGEESMSDPISFIGTMIPNNLFVGLFEGKPVAPLIPQLVEQVDELAMPERWRLLAEPPEKEIAALRQTLLDLHAVLSERVVGDRLSAVALQGAGRGGLGAAARVAHERGEARMRGIAAELEKRLREQDFSAQVLRRANEADSYRWPGDDFLVLVEAETIYDWQLSLDTLAEICRPLLADRIGFLMAPVRDGRVVGSYRVKVFDKVFPTDEVLTWPELPLPLLDEQLADALRKGLAALHEASGIVASVRSDEVHDDEGEVLEAACARAREVLHYIDDLLTENPDERLLGEVEGVLLDLSKTVEEEAATLANGQPVERSIAESFIAGAKGDGDDVFFAQIGAVAAAVEWDVEPKGAWERVQQALEPVNG